MADIIPLSKLPTDLHSDAGHAWVTDCVRAGEGFLSDADLTEKYELSPADWKVIKGDKALGRAVRAERERRVLDGTAARELACRHLVKGPSILDQIASAPDSHVKHKIDAIRELRATAAVGGTDRQQGLSSGAFIIRIDLTAGGGEVEKYDRTIDIKVNEERSDGVEGEW